MMNTDDFAAEHGITMTVKSADRNPNMPDDEWARSATHFRCVLRFEGRRLTTPFSQGSAHTSAPEVGTVLDSLAVDATSALVASDFEDWCSDLGYDADSRTAERTFRACERTLDKLRALLGEELADQLLNGDIDRL